MSKEELVFEGCVGIKRSIFGLLLARKIVHIDTLVREVRTGLEVSGLVLIVPEPSSWGDWLEFIRFGHVTIPTRSLIGCWLSPSPPSDLIPLNPWPSPVIPFQCSKHIVHGVGCGNTEHEPLLTAA
uniref:Uncharacterized protein n=1 Tax=Timema tahoe TaxID=61484 RepID=A0A7R9NWE5_9NEOP|nr:unnamed protein product [Timema tahoe]